MADRYCYAFVEDAPSREVALKLVAHRNASNATPLRFYSGFPSVTRGYGDWKKKCGALATMAMHSPVFCITDLDTWECPLSLLSDWFGAPRGTVVSETKDLVFRVAVREIEAWIMADRFEWASYLGISPQNFPEHPDSIPDPKQTLLNVLRAKGKKKLHANMLSRGSAQIGPLYNDVLCEFVREKWSPERASRISPSLKRAIGALQRL
jgi:hypothetical protein